jgi:hypothetical protein
MSALKNFSHPEVVEGSASYRSRQNIVNQSTDIFENAACLFPSLNLRLILRQAQDDGFLFADLNF